MTQKCIIHATSAMNVYKFISYHNFEKTPKKYDVEMRSLNTVFK